MKEPSEALILCEGYDDRSFWKGWLSERLHWPERRGEGEGRHSGAGVFTYATPAGGRVHVIPCQGRSRKVPTTRSSHASDVWAYADWKLQDRRTKPFSRLILNVDVDDGTVAALSASVQSLLGSGATRGGDGDWTLDDGALVSLLPWHVPAPDSIVLPGVPVKQTLERLLCTAICRAKPEWGADVKAWLASRHEPRGADHKAHAWSYAAGWFADHGPGDYHAAVWRDDGIAAQLVDLMRAMDAHRVVDALAELGTIDE